MQSKIMMFISTVRRELRYEEPDISIIINTFPTDETI